MQHTTNTKNIHDKHIQFEDYLFMQQHGKNKTKYTDTQREGERERNEITLNEMFRVKSFQFN